MSNLLKEYIDNILLELAAPKEKKDLEQALLSTSDANSVKFGSWRKGTGKYGEIRLAPAAPVPPGIDYSQLFRAAGYTAKKSTNSVSQKFDTWDVKTPSGVVQVVFTSKTLAPGAVGKSELQTIKILGFAGEHAVYAAMNNANDKVLRKNIENDSRISSAIATSNPDDIEKFFDDCATMRNSVKAKLSQLGINAKADKIPSTGTDEYDLTSTSGKEKYFIHVKYQSDRLVGIPKPSDQSPEDMAKNPSVIYKNVRDSLLFKGGLSGGNKTIDPVKDELVEGYLTPYGKQVLKKQRELGESEIAAIVKTPALRNVLYSALEDSNFTQNIADSLKQQLGLESKGEVVATTLFINFNSPQEIKTQMFVPGQGRNIKFSLRPGGLTSQAFIVDASFRSPRKKEVSISDVFNIELGSIKRAKYVQIHKGKNFNQFSKMLDSLSVSA